MATKIYLGQLMHLSAINAIESHATGISGVVRIGARVPDLEALLGGTTDSKVTDPDAAEAALLGLVRGLLYYLSTLNGKTSSDPATGTLQTTGNSSLASIVTLLGNQATAANQTSILNKLIAAPATEAKQDTGNTSLSTIATKINGGLTTITHTAVMVTTTTGQALASNSSRKYVLLVNDSDTDFYIELGSSAVANQGIRINAFGGNFEMSNQSGNLYTGAINVIHGGTGSKNLLVTEGV